MSSRNIYALLVGIDKYKDPVPALDGCVNDMRAMRDFLDRKARRNGTPLFMEVLENEDATRSNVVAKFETHLAKATKNDIAFFYYSGHGSQEPAHELFWKIESEHKNETLVCYDSRMPDGMDLADKELATLIDLVAQNNPHILVITDCCNSGDNTRGIEETKTRQTGMYQQPRALDTYILPRNFDSDRSALSVAGTESFIVPSPRHVALAAAHSFQLAKETRLGGSPRGVFTYSLLEVLENAVGPVTYGEIVRKVRSLVQQRTYDQIPQVTVADAGDLGLNFLAGTTTTETNYFLLSHSRKHGWELDAGAVHGMVAGDFSGPQTELSVFPDGASEEVMDDLKNELGRVSVKSVEPHRSLVRLEGDLFLDTDKVYRTKIYQIGTDPLKFFVKSSSSQAEELAREAWDCADQDVKVKLAIVNNLGEAKYKLIANNNQYLIARATDRDDQPLVEQIDGYHQDSAEKAIEYLGKIAQWEQVRKIRNPSSRLMTGSVSVEIFHPTEDRLLGKEPTGEVILRYRKSDGPGAGPRFRIKVVNRGNQKLYCSLVYMSSLFGIEPGMLPQGGLWLDSGEEIWVRDGAVLKGVVHENYLSFGKNSVQEVLKVIFSTKDFDSSMYRQEELTVPRAATRSVEGPSGARGFSFEEDARATGDDWNAAEYPVTIICE